MNSLKFAWGGGGGQGLRFRPPNVRHQDGFILQVLEIQEITTKEVIVGNPHTSNVSNNGGTTPT